MLFFLISAPAVAGLRDCIFILKVLREDAKLAKTTNTSFEEQDYARWLVEQGRLEEAYQILLDRELEKLSPEAQLSVRDIDQRRNYWDTNKGSYYYSDETMTKLVLDFAEKYRGSGREYEVRFHEIYHAIQEEKVRDAYRDVGIDLGWADFMRLFHLKKDTNAMTRMRSRVTFDLPDRFYFGLKQYYEEVGSMATEWKFLTLLSADQKNLLLEEVRQDPIMDPKYKAFVLRKLQSTASSPSRYVDEQHRGGRYSARSLLWKYTKDIPRRSRYLEGFLSSAVAFLVAYQYCAKSIAEDGTHPSSMLFERLCLKSPVFGENFFAQEIEKKRAAHAESFNSPARATRSTQ